MDKFTNMMYLLYVQLVLAGVTLAAETSRCPIKVSGATCTCLKPVIDCHGRGLMSVPSFSIPTDNFSILRLTNNSITHIDVSAFAALNVTTIDLSNNQINTISPQAFSGVSQSLRVLNLAHNSLTSLPEAISFLNHIEELDVTYNPIPGYTPGAHHRPGTDGLTDEVMRSIGDSIIRFKFGSAQITTWPNSLSHLNALQELTVAGVNIFYWPPTSFHGFEQTLRKLFLEDLSIGAVPVGLATLTQLRELHLDYFKAPFDDGSMISLPFGALAGTLEILSLKSDQLTYFPDGIKDLTSLKNLTLDGNDLEYVSDEAIQLLKNADVTYLSLQNCNLKRVPGAISDLKALSELDLSDNHIRSIESTDLQHLANLTTLRLNQNPLKYISDNSLCGLNKLKTFELRNTSLTEVSTSFKNLGKMQLLDLELSQIDCTCDMTWMSFWTTSCITSGGMHIKGACETIDQLIEEYILHRLPNCIGYHEDRRTFSCSGTCAP